MVMSVDLVVSIVRSVLETNMLFLVATILLAASVSAAPGYPGLLGDYHAPALLPAPTIIKAAEPVYSYAPAPTIIKAAAPVYAAPVVKAVAPATSYATVTQVHVTHPQIVKVAQPVIKVAQPILKAVVAPQPIIAQPWAGADPWAGAAPWAEAAPWAGPAPWAGGWH